MRRGAKQSVVWNYFYKNVDNTASCLICKKLLKHFGGTTNLRQHLIRVHPAETASDFVASVKTEENNPDISNNEDSSILNESNIGNVVGESEKHWIVEVAGLSDSPKRKRTKFDDGKHAAKHQNLVQINNQYTELDIEDIDFKLLKMITKDFQPLSIVENEGFVEFIHELQPLYKLPTEERLTYEILPRYYVDLVTSLKIILNDIQNVSITTDIWTSDSNSTYITVASCFIYEDELCTRVLTTKEIPVSHTSENIGNVLVGILEEWNITDKVVTVITDDGANMKEAINDFLQKDQHACIAHIVNLIVNESVSSNESLNIVLDKFRNLVQHFKYSTEASDKLKSVQIQMDLPTLKVKQDSATRWTSTYIMLDRLFQIKDALCVVLSDLSDVLDVPDEDEWSVLSDCLKVLKPVNDFTSIISKEKYPTISLVVPLTRGFQCSLRHITIETDVGETFKNKLLDCVKNKLGNLESNNNIAKAVFLDPRFKHFGFELNDNAVIAQKWVTEELDELITSQKSDMNLNKSTEETVVSKLGKEIDSSSTSVDIWSHFDRKVSEIKTFSTPTKMATQMVRQYLDMSPLERTKNPLEFWWKHKLILPELYELAMKYLCIPSTTIPSERLFSKTGELINFRRNQLDPELLDQIIFLNSQF